MTVSLARGARAGGTPAPAVARASGTCDRPSHKAAAGPTVTATVLSVTRLPPSQRVCPGPAPPGPGHDVTRDRDADEYRTQSTVLMLPGTRTVPAVTQTVTGTDSDASGST